MPHNSAIDSDALPARRCALARARHSERHAEMYVRIGPNLHSLIFSLDAGDVAETRDLDENTLLDLDAQGNLCAMIIEHASKRAGAPELSYERVPA